MPLKSGTVYGNVIISDDCIAKIAAVEAMHCIGVVGMAFRSKADQLASLLKKDSVTKGVKVISSDKRELVLQLHVIAEYGVNLAVISKNIIENVKYAIKTMTGYDVKKVEVSVEGLRVD